MKQGQLNAYWRIAAVVLVIVLSLYLFSIRERIQELEGYGYPGVFLFNLLSSATLILPVPGVAVTAIMGGVFEPFWVAVAAGSGAALGELSGYLTGFSGQAVIERTPVYERIEGWMRKYGEWAILGLAFVPNPLFDMAGIIAGAAKMPVVQFLLWCWLGKVLKMLMFAYFGASLLRLLPFL